MEDPQMLITEPLIVELLQANIEQAVRKLYNDNFENTVAMVCANGGNREDGADIFQEAVLILIEKIREGKFRGESSIKTFLMAIARNRWLFEMRTRERRKTREALYMDGEAITTSPTDAGFTKQATMDLMAVLNEIGDTCKSILSGVYYEKKTMKELLARFNYENEQVLRNRKSRCMKKLKELIQNNPTLLNNLKPISNEK